MHGIPGDLTLQEGDIVSIDLGVTWRGYVSDAAFTATVGDVPPEVSRLLERTEAALHAGIEHALPGKRIGDISSAVGAVGNEEGYGIIREYGGHGVGRNMHEEPHIPNYGRPGVGHQLKPGMVLALEPMFSLGGEATEEEPDRWTVRMRDGSLCAHFEETIAVTEGAPEILTSMGRLSEAREGRSRGPGRGRRLMAKGRQKQRTQRQAQQRKKKEVIEVEGVVKDALPQRPVRCRAGERAPRAGARLRKDEDALHPHPARGPRTRGVEPLRPHPGTDHLPLPLARERCPEERTMKVRASIKKRL